jgi:hypothetical protein
MSRTIHPFPARMAPDIALACMSTATRGSPLSVLDPMCGSGTVLSIATAQGHHAEGFDIDPLAVLISTVAIGDFDTSNLATDAIRLVQATRRSRMKALPWSDNETLRFAEYWFADRQRSELNRLSHQINGLEDTRLRQVMQVALSRIIITKKPKASLAADTSHSRPHRVITSSDYDVLAGFIASVNELARLLNRRTLNGIARVRLGDVRDLDVAAESIDLVVTSPPYLNAIDYLRGHRLALIWFGYSIPELRLIRSESVGANRALDVPPEPTVTTLVQLIESSVANPESLPAPTIARFARDISLFASELYRVARHGATVTTVVGNSTLRDNFIRNDLLVSEALRAAGFMIQTSSSRDLPESQRYMPISPTNQNSRMAKRMRTETVLTATKS